MFCKWSWSSTKSPLLIPKLKIIFWQMELYYKLCENFSFLLIFASLVSPELSVWISPSASLKSLWFVLHQNLSQVDNWPQIFAIHGSFAMFSSFWFLRRLQSHHLETFLLPMLVFLWKKVYNWLKMISKICLVVTSKKNKSIFKDIIQIKVDHPPSYPIFDKLFFDKFWLGGAPTLPTEFLTKIQERKQFFILFYAWNLTQHENVNQISENMCKKVFISLKFIKDK